MTTIRHKAIVTDLDGVIRHWPASDRDIEATFGLPAGSIRREAFAARSLEPAIRGRVSDVDWRRDVALALQRRHPDSDAFGAVSAWSESAGVADERVLALLKRSNPPHGIVLMTNATSRLNEDLARLGLLDLFAAIVNSSALGSIKPEPAIYRASLRACGCEPGEALYIDDDPANVVAGTEAGMSSHLYQGHDPLRDFLLESGLPR